MMLMDVALSLCRNHFRKSFRTDYNGALVKEVRLFKLSLLLCFDYYYV